jgi:hypothetical protein
MNGVAVLTRLAELFSKYPPHANDYPILFRMRALGLGPGKPFDPGKLDPALAATVNAAAKQALDSLAPAMRKLGRLVNGWNILTENAGTYGTSYKQRAVIALGGLGANLPEDAVYPTAFVDGKGAPLSGANTYVLHFDKGKLPPANAFWSITMYDQDGFQVPIDSPSATATSSPSTRMVRSTYTCRPNRPARTRNRTGCPRRRTRRFNRPCGFTHRGQRSRTAHGHRRHSGRCIEREYSIAEPSPWPPRQSQTSDGRPAERKPT